MGKTEILGLVRHILTTAGGAGVSAGYLSENEMTQAISGILILVGAVWSYMEKRRRI